MYDSSETLGQIARLKGDVQEKVESGLSMAAGAHDDVAACLTR